MSFKFFRVKNPRFKTIPRFVGDPDLIRFLPGPFQSLFDVYGPSMYSLSTVIEELPVPRTLLIISFQPQSICEDKIN